MNKLTECSDLVVRVVFSAMELVGPSYRVHVGMGAEYPWALGYMLYAGMAYAMRNHFVLQIVSACCVLPLLLSIL